MKGKDIVERKFSKPADILNQLNKDFLTTTVDHDLKNALEEVKDGMDISLCVIDFSNMAIEYAGTYYPIYLVRSGILHKLEVDKIPINLFSGNMLGKKFCNFEIEIEEGDSLHLFSDGYADQFGGPAGKKFRNKNVKELILNIQHSSMADQKEVFDQP